MTVCSTTILNSIVTSLEFTFAKRIGTKKASDNEESRSNVDGYDS
jgi:hypothetical protein